MFRRSKMNQRKEGSNEGRNEAITRIQILEEVNNLHWCCYDLDYSRWLCTSISISSGFSSYWTFFYKSTMRNFQIYIQISWISNDDVSSAFASS